ncbi:hypothetical protein FFF34_014125 [Inquilinus sp. KBS0705]|nr:hypothetical protein FFF34_014125 [Inquilinus sp. KBS0705]
MTANSCKRERFSSELEQKKLERLLSLDDGQLQIPDFSFAGFERNEKAVPQVDVKVTLKPGSGDDGVRIQQAIDKVSAMPLVNGYRGAILLKAGTYQTAGQIVIAASGVILRGEGQSDSGTVVISTSKEPRARAFTFMKIIGGGQDIQEIGSPLEVAADSAVRVGATKIPVATTAGYNVGDTIVLVKTPNDAWINTIKMAEYGWTAAGYKMQHLRIVKRVDPTAIWIDIPVVDGIQKPWGGGYIAKASVPGRVFHSAIENMRLRSYYASDEDENHAWTAIQLSRATNCWVKNVTSQYFAFGCVGIYNQSDFNLVQDCAVLDPKSQPVGSRRYSFYIAGGMGNLIQRCYTRGGRHDFVTGARVTGPNVFLDGLATATFAETGPHHRWATGILFDNISGGQLRVTNRRETGTGQGWTGAQVMFWNCTASVDFGVFSPPTANNWGIGCIGSQQNGGGTYISPGHPVATRSIFISQLESRLGSAAVIRVTNDAQRDGTIAGKLANWEGN